VPSVILINIVPAVIGAVAVVAFQLRHHAETASAAPQPRTA